MQIADIPIRAALLLLFVIDTYTHTHTHTHTHIHTHTGAGSFSLEETEAGKMLVKMLPWKYVRYLIF